MIDVITFRGTNEWRSADGIPVGMLAAVIGQLDPERFRGFEPNWRASIGPDPELWGPALDASVAEGIEAGVRVIQNSPNVCGLLSYSLGGICASRILEGVRAGRYTNVDGSPLEIAFAVNIANPLRRSGDSVEDLCPPCTFGLYGQRGDWPTDVATREYADPADLITAAPGDSPLRIIDVGLSPFSFVEGARFGDVTYQIFDELLRWLMRDPVVNLGRYATAVRGVLGLLTPGGPHVGYPSSKLPGSDLVWTDHAAQYINDNFGL
ncbi:hypothetical protein NDR87_15195 [Nocardia sp. CDC159]|uniref:PE-PPE domain-containing protein n=1 Tax=Nocardia pulmonis TaxID=2951408 RepID=A0A9X2E9Z2_9NOCA|nr:MULTISPECIES: hypothetical protein [Nocardia]MCM6775563.1 hypothetical protein [Nocardia pulmonis]MCM6787703.1 hypothetical protein [Nocardia sp. CDC159]